MSIFEVIGGADVLVAAIDEFYERVLDDPELGPSFSGIDIDRLKAHQRAFLAVALGGPQAYEGRPLADAHDGLAITPWQFERTVAHLVRTFSSMGIEPHVIDDIAARLATLEPEIVEAQRAVS